MKTLVLGDIHGRLLWYDIVKHENPDKIIFLGDYVSTHERISSDQQLSNLEDILDFKAKNDDKVILLRGNHDMQHLGYYWAECSGYDRAVAVYMSSPEVRDRFLKLTNWIHIDNNIIFSHAGISSVWLNSVEQFILSKQGSQYDDDSIDIEILLGLINDIQPCELFGFTPDSSFDYCGDSETQPLTWIRPDTLCFCNVKGYDQVIGHTVTGKIVNMQQATRGKQNIWLCDSLKYGNYLIIEDGKYITKNLKK